MAADRQYMRLDRALQTTQPILLSIVEEELFASPHISKGTEAWRKSSGLKRRCYSQYSPPARSARPRPGTARGRRPRSAAVLQRDHDLWVCRSHAREADPVRWHLSPRCSPARISSRPARPLTLVRAAASESDWAASSRSPAAHVCYSSIAL
eukprot:scaffold193468_cov36-Tisochrysis_lutea.AAC.2